MNSYADVVKLLNMKFRTDNLLYQYSRMGDEVYIINESETDYDIFCFVAMSTTHVVAVDRKFKVEDEESNDVSVDLDHAALMIFPSDRCFYTKESAEKMVGGFKNV